MHSFCSSASTVRVLNHIQLMKWRSAQSAVFPYKKEVLKTLYNPAARIIYTDSKQQRTLDCEVHTEDKYSEQESVYLHEPFLKENFNIIDNRYFKLITLPNEPNNFDELLWTREFKDVLCRSPFLYDVELTKNSKNYSSSPVVFHHACEGILCSEQYSKHFEDKLDQVFSASSDNKVQENKSNKPSEDQLLHIIDRLTFSLINFFVKPQDYSFYHKNVVFQNNIRGVTIKGLDSYIHHMYFLKVYGFLHFARVKVEILKITHHTEDGSIRVRWRVNGLPRRKILFMFLRMKPIKWSQFVQDEAEWLDGFSVFHVGQDGLIYKHVCDKMMPDDELSLAKSTDLKTRLLGLLGLSPRNPAAGTLNSIFPCYRSQSISCKKLT